MTDSYPADLIASMTQIRGATMTDSERAIQCPRKPSYPADLVSTMTQRMCSRTGPKLRPVQAEALYEMTGSGGLIGLIGVGHGKTLIAGLAPTLLGCSRPLVMVPAAMVKPMRVALDEYRALGWLIPDVRLVSYSALSVESGLALLEDYAPDLIVLDEAHHLRHPEAARTRRFLRYMNAHPDTRLVALSGTLMRTSVKDFWHLSRAALGTASPLPVTSRGLMVWSAVLDDSDVQPLPGDMYEVARAFKIPAMGWAEKREAARTALYQHLRGSAGVVLTEGASVDSTVKMLAITSGLEGLDEAARAVGDSWERPDGEELSSPLEVWRVSRQVAQGFYYRWVWPDGVPDEEWLSARKAWSAVVRARLRRGTLADTPMLVERLIRAGSGHPHEEAALARWKGQSGAVPPVEAVWYDTSMLDVVEAWAKDGGLVWCESVAVAEALQARGVLPVFMAGDGPPPATLPAAVVSVSSHGTGMNLQAWSRNLVLSWSSSASVMEQLIGRTHRAGQTAAEVEVWYMAHTPCLIASVVSSIEQAVYIEDTTGEPQRILHAIW